VLDKQVQELQLRGMGVDRAKLQEIEDHAVQIGHLLDCGFLAVGALFIVFAFIIKQYPVPITIISLVLYLACAGVMAYLNPATLAAGAVVKIIIIVALAKSIQSARAYEAERRSDAMNTDLAGGFSR
jgi:predicted RND superfamily exporter protein